jgi:hypothetical protein
LKGLAKLYIQSECGISTWSQLREALLSEFSTRLNSAHLHQMLSSRKIQKKETVQEYFLIMKELASRGNVEDNALIQYTIDGITDDTSNKIILYGANNLKEFKRKLQIFESLRENSMKMFKTKKEPEIKEEVMKKQDMKYKKEEGKQIRCFNCGLKGHRSTDCKFKEKGTNCFKCNNYGHRAKECNEDNKQKKQSEIEKKSSPTVYLSNSLQDEEPPENHEICNREVTDRVNSRNFKNLKLCGTDFEALIDTGSDVNLIKASAFLKIGAPRFEETPLTLTGLGNRKVKTLGKFSTKINIDNCELVTEIHIVSDEAISINDINLIVGRPILNKVTLIMNSEGVMVTENVTEMKETNLLNDEKKVQKRIAAEDENTTEENDALPEGEVSKKISDEDKIEDTEENLNDALKITSSEDDVGVESEENKNLGETFGSGEEKRNASEDIESLGRKLEAALDKIAKEINSNIPKNEDDVSEVNLEDKEVYEACEEGSTEKVEEDFDNLGRRLVEAVDKIANELNCKNEEKDVCSVDVSEDKIENSEREVVTVIEERYELCKKAKQQIKKIHAKNIKNYNRKRKMAREYKPGDQVAIKRKRTQFKTNAKILPKYLGRYEVIKKIGNDQLEMVEKR